MRKKLGVKLPAWVARHGSKRSSAAVINTFRVFRIILTKVFGVVLPKVRAQRNFPFASSFQMNGSQPPVFVRFATPAPGSNSTVACVVLPASPK